MKNRNRTAAILLLVLVAFIAYVLPKAYNPIDGWSFLSLILREDTEYAKGYTDARFKSITEGMTKKELIRTMGEPLVYWGETENGIKLSYSRSPADTHYRIRVVVLANDRVAEVRSQYWVD